MRALTFQPSIEPATAKSLRTRACRYFEAGTPPAVAVEHLVTWSDGQVVNLPPLILTDSDAKALLDELAAILGQPPVSANRHSPRRHRFAFRR